jgi:sugar transferase (PEP-CTERM system associated)
LLYEDGFTNILIAVLPIVFAFYFQNVYADFRVRSRAILMQQVMLGIGVLFIVQSIFAYLAPDLLLSRWLIIVSSVLMLLAFPLWRFAYTNVLYKGLGVDRILFLGTDVVGVEIAEQIGERPELGFIGLGFVDDKHGLGEMVAGLPVLGPTAQLREIVARTPPNRIVVSLSERRKTLPVDVLLDLRFSGIRIEEAATMFEAAFGRVITHALRPSQLIFSSELGPQAWKMRVQTVYSFVIALIGFVVALPLMTLVALAVRITSPGPILFRQKRVGLNGKHFTLFKFRSMGVNAEAGTGAVWAKRNDPRVTSIGGFLRRTRLDELPQLFNVLRGDMAVVGPRPERPEFVSVLSEQIPFYRQRHAVKPGVTGWAQINYKYGDTIEDTIMKLEYDLYYIKNLSPSLDVFIVFHTVKVMLFSSHGQ